MGKLDEERGSETPSVLTKTTFMIKRTQEHKRPRDGYSELSGYVILLEEFSDKQR